MKMVIGKKEMMIFVLIYLYSYKSKYGKRGMVTFEKIYYSLSLIYIIIVRNCILHQTVGHRTYCYLLILYNFNVIISTGTAYLEV